MKIDNKIILSIILIAIASGLYRITPLREAGFAPQIAVAIFSGFMFTNNKKWAFILPIASMLISDIIFQILFEMGKTEYGGFYGKGQLLNYGLFVLITCIGFLINKLNVLKIAGAALAAPTIYFLLSNFFTWVGGGGFHRAKTIEGLMQCMTDGIPFYKASIYGTLIFSTILFGGYYLIKAYQSKKQLA